MSFLSEGSEYHHIPRGQFCFEETCLLAVEYCVLFQSKARRVDCVYTSQEGFDFSMNAIINELKL